MKRVDTGRDNVSQGVGLIIGAVFLLALADALVKYLSASIALWQLYILASLVSLPTLVGVLFRGNRRHLRVGSLRWIVIRSLLLLLMWIAYYAALPFIPLSVAAVGIYTTPLFIAILAAMGTDESLSRGVWCAILCGFAGVIVVLRPMGEDFAPQALLPIVAALLYALAMVATRRYCQREHPLVLALGLNLAFLMAGSLFGMILAFVDTGHLATMAPFIFADWRPISIGELSVVAVYALLLVIVNTAVAQAYQTAPSSLIGTFDYTYLIFATLWGYLLFDEMPDAMTGLGMGLILAAGLIVLQCHSYRQRA